jgi:hypothetical protein
LPTSASRLPSGLSTALQSRFRRLSAAQAWRDTWVILSVAVSRLVLILGVVIAEDLFNWVVAFANRILGVSQALPGSDLKLLLRYMLDALDISVLVAVLVLAGADILGVLVTTWFGRSGAGTGGDGA